MDHIRSTIEILFGKAKVESVLHSLGGAKGKEGGSVEEEWFCDALENGFNRYTRDDAHSLYGMLNSVWMYRPDQKGRGKKNLFHPLLHFVQDVLIEENEEPVCEYRHLLRWRSLSARLGEDLFTTSYLAWSDLFSQRRRNYFSWRPVITTNNYHLKEIFRKGMAELHFHLKGSSLNFDLNWLCLMNSIGNRRKDFKALMHARQPDAVYRFDEISTTLYLQCVKACAIRIWLFQYLQGELTATREKLFQHILKCKTEEEVSLYLSDLQRQVSCMRYVYGRKFGPDVVDYAIPRLLTVKDMEGSNLSTGVLYGERWLMYQMFRGIFGGDEVEKYAGLFYVYVLAKERFRQEMTQLNKRIGFSNFAGYEHRKEVFISRGSVYETLIANLAINSTLANQNIKYIEARITPRKSVRALKQTVNKFDRDVKDVRFVRLRQALHCRLCPHQEQNCFERSQKEAARFIHYYVLHFIKHRTAAEQKANPYTHTVKARNWGLRTEVKQQALALNRLRKTMSPVKERIVGIDAASSEIGFRPEIFAQAYRYLKYYSYQPKNEYISQDIFYPLGYTYHAGEDFLDLADGLRAIDECILHLNFCHGDRIGHALALGISASEYYALKSRRITLPIQDFLDNVAWLMAKSKALNIPVPPVLWSQLEIWFTECFCAVYDSLWNGEVSPMVYYQSMLLRGDDPYLYELHNGKVEVERDFINFWQKCGINDYTNEVRVARQIEMARRLYYWYHFDEQVKKRGNATAEFYLPSEYVELIEHIQEKMSVEIAHLHIGIETNPTSNYMIGTYKRYDKHPMKKFYNLGLTYDQNELMACPQISLSLNTDDQGVFSTYLENEYALMAIALEKECREDGSLVHCPRMIYEWLDHIRSMGFEQRFRKTNEL